METYLTICRRSGNSPGHGIDYVRKTEVFWPWELNGCQILYIAVLSPVYTGDKVEFNTVDFVESQPCCFGPVHTGDKVDCIGDKGERIGDKVEHIVGLFYS